MKTLLEEARQNIPHFDIIWESFKRSLLANMRKVQPHLTYGFYRYQFSILNIKVPPQTFFNSYSSNMDLYLIVNEKDYSKISPEFNDAEVSPNMSLDKNGKIEKIHTRFRVATSKKKMFDDILPDFYHELTHAYDFWGKLKNGAKSQDLASGLSYDTNSLRSIISNPKLTPLEKNLAVLYYFVDTSEYNGRLNTFYGQIKSMDLSKGDYKNIIESTKVWKSIVFLHNVIYYMEMVKNPSDQKKLIRVANAITKNTNNFKDYKTLLNDVNKRYETLKNNSYNDFCEIIDELRQQKR